MIFETLAVAVSFVTKGLRSLVGFSGEGYHLGFLVFLFYQGSTKKVCGDESLGAPSKILSVLRSDLQLTGCHGRLR